MTLSASIDEKTPVLVALLHTTRAQIMPQSIYRLEESSFEIMARPTL
jgi:hypothetical protein